MSCRAHAPEKHWSQLELRIHPMDPSATRERLPIAQRQPAQLHGDTRTAQVIIGLGRLGVARCVLWAKRSFKRMHTRAAVKQRDDEVGVLDFRVTFKQRAIHRFKQVVSDAPKEVHGGCAMA